MFDPIAVAGTAALAESVKFLRAQIADVARCCPARSSPSAGPSDVVIVPAAPAGALDRPLVWTRVAAADLERVTAGLLRTGQVLAEYADGGKPITLVDGLLLESAATARALLEALYRRHLTFTGETRRPATGTALTDAEVESRMVPTVVTGTGAGTVVSERPEA